LKNVKLSACFLVIVLVLVSLGVGSGLAIAGDISVEKAIYEKLKKKNLLGKIYKDKFHEDMPEGMDADVIKIKSPLHGITNYKKEEYPEKPLLVATSQVTNCCPNKVTKTLGVDRTTEISSTWSIDKTLSIGSSATVSGEVPFGPEVSYTVTTEFSVTKTHSVTKTKTLHWLDQTDVDIDPYTRILTQFIVEGKDEENIPFWVDFNVKGLVDMKFAFPHGRIKFYDENGAHGKKIGDFSDKSYEVNLKKHHVMKNDEARSVKLCGVIPGTELKVWDNPDASSDDDYTIIKVKKWKSEIIINTFEHSYEDEYVKVSFHKHNGLDGKISRFRVRQGRKERMCTINIENYLSEEDRKIHITGVWKGCGAVNTEWIFSEDPNFHKSDCKKEECTVKQTGEYIKPKHVKRLPGPHILRKEVKPR